MLPPLSADPTFAYQLLVLLGHVNHLGADVGPILSASAQLVPGDTDSWHAAFARLAARSEALARDDGGGGGGGPRQHPHSKRTHLFAAATYARAAQFFLHGPPDQPEDPRLAPLAACARRCFDDGLTLLRPHRASRHTIPTPHGFAVESIFLRSGAPTASPGAGLGPTLILGTGFDGAMESLLHWLGLAALDRGFHVVLYEGPGQPTVARTQRVGFRPDWECVVSPLLDFYLAPDAEGDFAGVVDPARVGLLGLSLGGYLAPRAAAFEHRLAAVVACDGVINFGEAALAQLRMPPPAAPSAAGEGEAHGRPGIADAMAGLPIPPQILDDPTKRDVIDARVCALLTDAAAPVQARWAARQALFAFQTSSAWDFFQRVRAFRITEEMARAIRCPVLVMDAEDDHFFRRRDADGRNQPERLARAIGERARLVRLGREDGAEEHCHLPAVGRLEGVVLDWFGEVLGLEGW